MQEYLKLIKNPRIFFKSVKEENISATIKKVVLILIILLVISTILSQFIFRDLYSLLDIQRMNPIASIFSSIISLPLGLIFMAALLHLSLKILKSKSKFSQTLKVLIYTTVIGYVFSIVSYLIAFLIQQPIAQIVFFIICGVGIAIYIIAVTAIGLSEFYKISIGKAVGAYFLSIGLLIAAMLVLFIIFFIIALLFAFIFKVPT